MPQWYKLIIVQRQHVNTTPDLSDTIMFFQKLKSVNKPDPAHVLKPSPSEEAAALSKLWKQYVKNEDSLQQRDE
jgi:hypothetical protein